MNKSKHIKIDWDKPLRLKYISTPYALHYIGKSRDGYSVVEIEPGEFEEYHDNGSPVLKSPMYSMDIENVPPKKKRYIFTETGEYRKAKRGEWYESRGEFICAEYPSLSEHSILKMTEEEIDG